MLNIPHRHLADSVELEKCFAENYWQVQEQDIVCVPSLSMKQEEVRKITGVMHYEERQLFNILLLKYPSTRLIYVTSMPLDPFIVQYYLSLLPPNISREDAEKRLILLSTNDLSPRALSEKILERPRMLARIKGILRPNRGLLLTFTSTELECKLAIELGVPIFGNDNPSLEQWGSKSGGREIFGEAGIPHARGVEISYSGEDLAKKIVEFVNDTNVTKLIVKLNYGFSGKGNANLDLSGIASSGQKVTEAAVLEALAQMEFSDSSETWSNFQETMTQMGAIAEEFYIGEDPKSPSVQGCISMTGDVEILSTHEQILQGQVYQGCLFPASNVYREQLQRYGRRVGRVLAKKGVRGHYGVDFLVTAKPPSGVKQEDNQSEGVYVFALEINLRQCGTTHPYFTMKFLTGGSYDKRSGLCYGSKGALKYYTASDNIHKEQYIGLLPQDVVEGFARKGLTFNYETQTGIAFHLLGSLSEHGKVGVTCVGDTPEAAAALFEQVQKILEELAAGPQLAARVPVPKKDTLPLRTTAQGETTQELTRKILTPQNTSFQVGDSNNPNAIKLLITVGIHGDEVCGVHAVNELITENYFGELNKDKLSLTIILGNPLAYMRNQRFVDQNLNRVMLPHLFEKGGYETFRARGICQAIIDCDAYMDIHSTSADTAPFALPAENVQSGLFASTFPLDYTVLDLLPTVEARGTTVDWAFFHNKLALGIECGKHDATASVTAAKRCIKHFITMQGAVSPAPHTSQSSKILRCVSAEKVREGFKYLRDIKSFDFVKHGDAIAKDTVVGDIKCTADKEGLGAYLVMPTKIPYLGEEAFYWAVPTELPQHETTTKK